MAGIDVNSIADNLKDQLGDKLDPEIGRAHV